MAIKKPYGETMAVIIDVMAAKIIEETNTEQREIYKRCFLDFNSFVNDTGRYSNEEAS